MRVFAGLAEDANETTHPSSHQLDQSSVATPTRKRRKQTKPFWEDAYGAKWSYSAKQEYAKEDEA